MSDPHSASILMLRAGRLVLGGLFLIGGVRHLVDLRTVARQMTKRGVPFAMGMLIAGTSFQILAGVLLMSNVWTIFAALGLVFFTLVSSLLMLDFWHMSGEQRMGAIDNWQSNLGVIGGLLILTALALERGVY